MQPHKIKKISYPHQNIFRANNMNNAISGIKLEYLSMKMTKEIIFGWILWDL